MLPKPTKELAIRLIQNNLPEYGEMLLQMQKDKGWVIFKPWVYQSLEKLNITDYAKLYTDEVTVQKLFIVAYFDLDEFKEINEELEHASEKEKTAFLDNWIAEIDQDNPVFEWDTDEPETLEKQEEARKEFESIIEAEQTDLSKRFACFLAFFLINFHNYLAIMVHGRTMFQLVNEAIQGDDDAFVLAAQIDSTVLLAIPYFQQRVTRARREGDKTFLNKHAYRQKTPPLHGKIRFPLLYLLFAILESINLLEDLQHKEILEICDKAGLDRWQNQIEDLNNLTKRLREYRRFQTHKYLY